MFKSIKKRNGQVAPFKIEKITNAIYKASVAVGSPDWELAENLAKEIISHIGKKIKKGAIPTVEEVQDMVEQVLINTAHAKIAKAYILYREHRADIRQQKEQILNKTEIDEVDKKFDLNALRVLVSRYLKKSEDGQIIESPKDLFIRVAVHSALPSIFYDQKVYQKRGGASEHRVEDFDPKKFEGKFAIGKYKLNQFHLEGLFRLYSRFSKNRQIKISWPAFLDLFKKGYFDKYEAEISSYYEAMINRKFLPNTPALANFGNYLGMGSACFTLAVEDSIDLIMDSLKAAAIIFKSGGGVGYNFSHLRPEGDFVKTTGGSASGPISFMSMFDNMTEVIKQGGIRRGANMGILNSDHPDIEKFVKAKEGNKALRNFNISIMVKPEFWEALKENKMYKLVNPKNGKVVKEIDPKQLLDLIAYHAWEAAEPGILFFDRINENNPLLKGLGPIESTNPCVVGDTLVSTKNGFERIRDLRNNVIIDKRAVVQAERDLIKVVGGKDIRIMGRYDKEKTLKTRGVNEGKTTSVFPSGIKEVFLLETKSGYEIKATADHKFLTPYGWKKLEELSDGDYVYIQSSEGNWGSISKLPIEVQNLVCGKNGRIYKFNFPDEWDKNLGRLLGWLVGDGWLSEKNHSLGFVFADGDKEVREKLQPILENYLGGKISVIKTSPGVQQLRSASLIAVDFFKNLGIKNSGEQREVPQAIFNAPKETVVGFIEGLFSSDGTVGTGSESRNYVRLNSSSRKLLKQVQLLLLNFGIRSAIFDRSAEPKVFSYVKADGGKKIYKTSGENYELNISKENLKKFIETFEFLQTDKNNKLKSISADFEFYREYFTEQVGKIEKLGKELVWDLTEATTHSFIGNGFVLANCGEVLLYPFESCNLGSVNVWNYLKKNGGKNPHFDWQRLGEDIKLATRFLDNVVDINKYPLQEIEEISLSSRKLGLGLMGLGDLLYELEIPYNSKEGLAFMEKLMEFINYYSKVASIDLSKERGRMPYFDKSFFKEGRLPFSGFKDKQSWNFDWKDVSNKIKKYGIRNSFNTVIAPTGSISMIAGCSSGIEPVFSLVFEKNITIGSFYYVDPVFEERMHREGLMDEALIKDVVTFSGSIQNLSYMPPKLKKIFVTAMDITPKDHIKVLAAFQKWTDSAISKTTNLPNTATAEDIKEIYVLAHDLGCKGVTIYRDKSLKTQVLNGITKKHEKKVGAKESDLIPMKDEKAKGLAIYHKAGVKAESNELGLSPASSSALASAAASMGIQELKECPACHTKLARQEGCLKCPSCGWGLCS